MKINNRSVIFLFIVAAIATIVKVVCAPQINLSGFSAILAIALFAGFVEKDSKTAFLLPLAIVFISDVFIQLLYSMDRFPFAGFYNDQWINYLLIGGLTFVGMFLRKGKLLGMLTAAILGPALFFLISNYIVWSTQYAMMGYTHDLKGLMECYTAGIPFYRNSVIATILFLPSFAALYQWIIQRKISFRFAT